LGARTDNRNRLVACPENCGAFLVVRQAKGLFAKPVLEFAFGAQRKGARSETQSKKRRA
jgi:hypothetical protein